MENKVLNQEQLTRKLRRAVWQVQETFNIVEPGDKIMVCLSGGKDSYTMLDMLLQMQLAMQHSFEIVAVNLDQKQPGFPEDVLPQYLESLKVPYRILERDTYSVVTEKTAPGKTMCTLCSRLRRGILYDAAREMSCNKLALGHHREDILETFFLNLFFAGKLEAMPAKYRTDDQQHIVIRPLAFCREEDIAAYADYRQFPIIPCNLCGSQENMQRKVIKQMMIDWEKNYPNRKEIMLTALSKVHPSHLLDVNLFDFSLPEEITSITP